MLAALATALTTGLGCGACCGPVVSGFLSVYVLSHANGLKSGALAFGRFYLGKILCVTCLCALSAALGRQLVSAEGTVGGLDLRLASRVALAAVGAALSVRWLIENARPKPAADCRDCAPRAPSGLPPFLAGAIYGATPCAPLLLMLGYTFALPIPLACAAGATFALATALGPSLLMLLLSGALSAKLAKEIPGCVRWFRLASYLLLILTPFWNAA